IGPAVRDGDAVDCQLRGGAEGEPYPVLSLRPIAAEVGDNRNLARAYREGTQVDVGAAGAVALDAVAGSRTSVDLHVQAPTRRNGREQQCHLRTGEAKLDRGAGLIRPDVLSAHGPLVADPRPGTEGDDRRLHLPVDPGQGELPGGRIALDREVRPARCELDIDDTEVVQRVTRRDVPDLPEVPDADRPDPREVLAHPRDPLGGPRRLLLFGYSSPDELVRIHRFRCRVPPVFVEPNRLMLVTELNHDFPQELDPADVDPVGMRLGCR